MRKRRESFGLRTTVGRRLLTIPGYVVAWLLCVGTAPLWLPLTAIVDAVRRNGGVALRSAVFLTYYLSCEVLGIAISAGVWAWTRVFPVDPERWADLHYRLEAWWGTTRVHAHTPALIAIPRTSQER